MKKMYRLGLFCAVASSAFLFVPAAAAEEAAPAAEQQQTEAAPAEILKKTTHGRGMLSRDNADDPESGRFMRALLACIRYYTGSSN
ncbi:MAG: hypothetical protein HPZ91_17365 [Lentisphaeria bacterium]|nr:hypothetical protein [Lentisphaeria bacterium]